MDESAGCKEDQGKAQLEEIKKTVDDYRQQITNLKERIAELEGMIESANAFVLQRPTKEPNRR